MMSTGDEYDIAFKYYKYRVPYSKVMCESLARELGFNQDTAVLDLACGDGALTSVIAPHVGRIVAIDSSKGMLSVAYQHDKIRYIHHDQNREPFAEGQFDCVTVGRALNWLSLDNLSATMTAVARRDGALVICSASFQMQSWWATLRRIMQDYGIGAPTPQSSAMAKLPNIGFHHQNTIADRFGMRVRPSFLLNHMLSYAPITKAIEADIENVKARVAPVIRPMLRDGYLIAPCVSWAAIWKRL
jgi:SAM-dependent methyltransferase